MRWQILPVANVAAPFRASSTSFMRNAFMRVRQECECVSSGLWFNTPLGFALAWRAKRGGMGSILRGDDAVNHWDCICFEGRGLCVSVCVFLNIVAVACDAHIAGVWMNTQHSYVRFCGRFKWGRPRQHVTMLPIINVWATYSMFFVFFLFGIAFLMVFLDYSFRFINMVPDT